MIGYLKGTLLKKEEDRILLLVGQVGYEVLLPAVVMETLAAKRHGDEVALYIFFQQTERQPKPVLIGFNLEAEREFFQHFISVEDIGPLKAVKALNIPIRDIARAIETGDLTRLTQLKGIGKRTAQKIVATLSGKMEKFVLIRKAESEAPLANQDFVKQVLEVLTEQLGHKPAEAKRMVADALARNPGATTPESLFEEVYRGEIAR
ncbi:MAG: Holliday junction DNA helicase RuvA [Desulfobacterales bacterium CG23_combo_of_CG06-09_8_20_14_all_52_9]|nr:MAG: Holliday junction DNA helicase RuvA [Desulfobacterales bacterium CG23_combo_of_CG06-09_8_20_14_all_52_9]